MINIIDYIREKVSVNFGLSEKKDGYILEWNVEDGIKIVSLSYLKKRKMISIKMNFLRTKDCTKFVVKNSFNNITKALNEKILPWLMLYELAE
jgi:hypothetical protein